MSLNLSEAESIALESLSGRLDLIRDRVRSVVEGYGNGLYLFGEGGIGKSFTVVKELERLGVHYKVTNSRLTGKGLFELLEDHPDSIHVLEDMETLCKDKNAAGVLRSALWTTDPDKSSRRQERLITWRVSGEKRSANFTGGIIFTMNAALDDLPEMRAVKTRIAVMKLEPTNAEVAALMKSIALMGHQQGGRSLSPNECMEVFDFVKATCDRAGRNYDLRMFVNGCADRLQWRSGHSKSDWQDLLSSRLRERVVRSIPTTRAGRMKSNQEIAIEIDGMAISRGDKMTLWKDRTGTGQSAYYERLKEAILGEVRARPDTSVKGERERLADDYDFFATGEDAIRYLLDQEKFDGEITEPCSGDGAIVEVLKEYGYEVMASDIRETGIVGKAGVNLHDLDHAVNIVTNPPYTDFGKHVEHMVNITDRKVACLLPQRFVGTSDRHQFLIKNPPARIYHLAKRPIFYLGGRGGTKQSPGWEFAWYVWDKLHKGSTSETIYDRS